LVISLRHYRPEDFDRLLEIDQLCFIEGIAYDAGELRHFFSLPTAATLVAEEAKSGAIHGFLVADRLRRRGAPGFMGRVITIDVVPEQQHLGIGTLLIARAEEELKRGGCDQVVLEVAVNNERALRFYKKHGYSVLKVLPKYYLDSIDGLMMGKRLTQGPSI
jgi:ribosomal-protein-alanine N-acetyltransferase